MFLNFFIRPLMMEADNGGNGGGGGGESVQPQDKKPEEKPAEKTFTQTELDEIIAQRLERERKKYADYDELKAKLSEYEKAEEERKKAQMSEQERLQAEKEEAERRAEEAKKTAHAALEAANKRLIKSEFKVLAIQAGMRTEMLDDAFVLADLSGVTVNDEGEVDKGALKKAIDQFIESRPIYKADYNANGGTITVGQHTGGSNVSDEIKSLEAQLEKAKKDKNFSEVVRLSNVLKTKRGK